MHHLLVYECHGNFSNASLYGSGFDCSVPNMPLRSCYDYSVVAAWAVGGTVRRLTYSSPEESNFKFEIFWLLKGFSLLFLKKCMFYYQIGILLSTEGWVSSWYVELAKNVFSWATLWQSWCNWRLAPHILRLLFVSIFSWGEETMRGVFCPQL